jgi:hypothetical protein
MGISPLQAGGVSCLVILVQPIFDRMPDTIGFEILRPQVHMRPGKPETVLNLRPQELLKLTGKSTVSGIACDPMDERKCASERPETTDMDLLVGSLSTTCGRPPSEFCCFMTQSAMRSAAWRHSWRSMPSFPFPRCQTCNR